VGDGGGDNRLLIQAPKGWVLFSGRRGEPALTLEISAGRALPEGAALTAEQQQVLWDRGLRRARASDNFSRLEELKGAEHAGTLASEVLGWLSTLFGYEGPATVDLALGDFDPTENPGVVQLMQEQVNQRGDLKSRKRLWSRLMRATLLVPLKRAPAGEVGIGAELPLRVFGELGGAEVVGAFTDATALRAHDPRPLPYARLTGAQLFPLLAARRVASMLLNPGQGVRGELYRHEIETIAEAVQRTQGSH
jgi:hypothetical protein